MVSLKFVGETIDNIKVVCIIFIIDVKIFLVQEKTLNVEGFSDLLRNCCHLRHLNIGGSHHHIDDHSTGEKIKSVLSSIKGSNILLRKLRRNF